MMNFEVTLGELRFPRAIRPLSAVLFRASPLLSKVYMMKGNNAIKLLKRRKRREEILELSSWRKARQRYEFLEKMRNRALLRDLKLKDHALPEKTLYTVYRRSEDQWANALPVISTFTKVSNLEGTNARSRVLDPNWKVKVAKKLDATNAYSFAKTEGMTYAVKGSYLYTPTNGSGPGRGKGILIDAPTYQPLTWDDFSTDQVALKRIKRKISDSVGFYNAAVPIAELRELRMGAVSLIDSVSDVYNKLHARIVQRRLVGKSYRKAVADAWLQWSFGIKPTLSSIRDANKAITQFLERSDHIVRLRGAAMISRNVNFSAKQLTFMQYASCDNFLTGTDTLFYQYVGSFNLKVKSSNDYSAANVFGLEPSSILPVLYELTPYSWLVDYLTSVGDYLNDTFEVPPGMTIYLSKTKVRLISGVSTAKAAMYLPGVANSKVDPGYYRRREITRIKLDSLPHLALRIKTPSEIARNAEQKLANLLSVLKSAHGAPYGIRGKGLLKDPVSKRRVNL